MKREYTVHYDPGLNRDYSKEFDIRVEEVGECPLCHFATSPTYIDGFVVVSLEDGISPTAYLLLYCPRCRRTYIAQYIGAMGMEDFVLSCLFPKNVEFKEFSEGIEELSSEFVSLYRQALTAESNCSMQGLAGMGYRKALEFLIKDYLIKIKHQDRETISKLDLMKCVDKLDEDLKEIARASVWLGNDETHYFRKNPEYDTEDLKAFIECLVAEMNMECTKRKARALLKRKK